MSKRDVRLLLGDILDSARKIIKYTAGLSYDQFLSDGKTIDATVRNFEIIGEAAKRLPPDYKLTHPEIDWAGIIGFRNRIIHEYFGIQYDVLWQIKDEYIPDLVDWMETYIEEKP